MTATAPPFLRAVYVLGYSSRPCLLRLLWVIPTWFVVAIAATHVDHGCYGFLHVSSWRLTGACYSRSLGLEQRILHEGFYDLYDKCNCFSQNFCSILYCSANKRNIVSVHSHELKKTCVDFTGLPCIVSVSGGGFTV